MKGPVVVSQTGVGTGNVPQVPVDPTIDNFNVGLQAVITGTVTYNVEYTLDDIRAAGWSAATANWTAAPNFSALTANAGGSLTIPCTAVRLNVTAGTGTVKLSIMQSGRTG